MSNILDPDQARHFVGLYLGPNCLQRLSADDTSRQRAKKCKNKNRDSELKKLSKSQKLFSACFSF